MKLLLNVLSRFSLICFPTGIQVTNRRLTNSKTDYELCQNKSAPHRAELLGKFPPSTQRAVSLLRWRIVWHSWRSFTLFTRISDSWVIRLVHVVSCSQKWPCRNNISRHAQAASNKIVFSTFLSLMSVLYIQVMQVIVWFCWQNVTDPAFLKRCDP